MTIVDQPLRGVFLVQPRLFRDVRGVFVKTLHAEEWRAAGLPPVQMAEEFWSASAKDVLRGMHFQIPPEDHEKVVTCTTGRVLDVLLDLRTGGPTFGATWSGELSAANGRVLVVPRGVAHGFLSLEEGSVMLYKTSTVHSPACDAGIRWDSFGFNWPVAKPVVSERDGRHPGLSEFVSPF